MSSERFKVVARGGALPLFVIALWWWYGKHGGASSALFVSMKDVVEMAVSLCKNGSLPSAIWISLGRCFSGLLLGGVAGLAFGVVMGGWKPFRHAVSPLFGAVKQVSIFAWIPLIMTWLGLGEVSRIFFIAMAAFFPVALNTIEGVSRIPKSHLDVARIFVFTRWQIFSRLIIPSILPSVFTGLYLALVYAWMATLGAEYMLTSNGGMGDLLVEGRDNLWISQLIVCIIVVCAVGFAFNQVATLAEKRLLRWRNASNIGDGRDFI